MYLDFYLLKDLPCDGGRNWNDGIEVAVTKQADKQSKNKEANKETVSLFSV